MKNKLIKNRWQKLCNIICLPNNGVGLLSQLIIDYQQYRP